MRSYEIDVSYCGVCNMQKWTISHADGGGCVVGRRAMSVNDAVSAQLARVKGTLLG